MAGICMNASRKFCARASRRARKRARVVFLWLVLATAATPPLVSENRPEKRPDVNDLLHEAKVLEATDPDRAIQIYRTIEKYHTNDFAQVQWNDAGVVARKHRLCLENRGPGQLFASYDDLRYAVLSALIQRNRSALEKYAACSLNVWRCGTEPYDMTRSESLDYILKLAARISEANLKQGQENPSGPVCVFENSMCIHGTSTQAGYLWTGYCGN